MSVQRVYTGYRFPYFFVGFPVLLNIDIGQPDKGIKILGGVFIVQIPVIIPIPAQKVK